MPHPITCPNIEDLRQLLLGQVPGPEAERLKAHLAQCSHCREAVQAAPANDTLGGDGAPPAGAGKGPVADTVAEHVDLAIGPQAASVLSSPDQTEEGTPPAHGSSQEVTADFIPPVTSPAGEATVSLNVTAGELRPSDAARELHECLAAGAAPGEFGRLGPYHLLEVLGAGGMGMVYKAEDRQLHRLVAVKAILPTLAASPSARKRFLREARLAAALEHDHIVPIYHVGEDRGVPFLAMQLLRGESLDGRLRRERRIPLPEVLRIGREVAQGLAAAHERGLVHRDIKPANVWLEGKRAKAIILDFGLARAVEDSAQLTQQGAIVGTPGFMAPEQVAGQALDPRCDLFSLGCVLYRLSTGEQPFKGKDTISTLMAVTTDYPRPPGELNPDLPPVLADLIMRLLAKDPAYRPRSARVVVKALQAVEDDRTGANRRRPRRRASGRVSASEVAVGPRPTFRRRLLLPAVLAAVLLAGLALAAVFAYRTSTDKGDLIISADSPDVEVLVQQGGRVVQVIDTKTNKSIKLYSGEYTLSLKDQLDGLKLSPDRVTIKRGDTVLATVENVKKTMTGQQVLAPPPVLQIEVVEVRRFVGHTNGVCRVVFCPDGRQALSSSADSTLRLWDVESGTLLRVFEGHSGWIWGLAISQDGSRALSGSDDETMRLWDVASGRELRRFVGHKKSVRCVAYSPDGRHVVSGGDDGTIRLWDIENPEREVRRFEGHQDQVFCVAFSSDGHRILSGGADQTMRLWDVETGKELRRFAGHTGIIWSVVFSHDNRRTLSGGADQTMRLWDVETGKELRRFDCHSPGISVALSRNDRWALSGSDDRILRLWDVETGKELRRYVGHTYPVWSEAFSPDGSYAISASQDMTLRLWRLPELDSP